MAHTGRSELPVQECKASSPFGDRRVGQSQDLGVHVHPQLGKGLLSLAIASQRRKAGEGLLFLGSEVNFLAKERTPSSECSRKEMAYISDQLAELLSS